MLEEMNLDTGNFQELFDKNKQYLQTLLPYIDVNRDSEPAITLLEMMTMLSDIENYSINRILPSHYEKYMALLGITKEVGKSARAYAFVYPQVNHTLLAGTPFNASDEQRSIHYESVKPSFVVRNEIAGCFLQVHNTLTPFFNHQAITLADVRTQALYILFKQPLHSTCTLYFQLLQNTSNTNTQDEYSEATIQIEYYSDKGWRRCALEQDDTHGLLQSGCMRITPYFKSASLCIQGKTGYPIRICIIEANYDIVPIIQRIEINPIELIQKKTLINQREVKANHNFIEYVHILEKTGNVLLLKKRNTSYQEVLFTRDDKGIKVLDDNDKIAMYLIISYDPSLDRQKYIFDVLGISSQEISIDIPNIATASLQLVYKKDTRYYKFTHFHYDSNTQSIRLGNGKDFTILPFNKECLWISQLDTTLYQDGDIRHDTLTCKKEDVYCVHNSASYDSAMPDTVAKMIERTKQAYNNQMDILTTYRTIVKQTPYLSIKEVGIFLQQQFYHQEDREGIIIIIEKTTKKPLTRKQTECIYRQLKKHAYINSLFEIRSLKYIPITITIFVQISKQSNTSTVKKTIYNYIEKEEIQEWYFRKQELQVCILQLANVLQVIKLDIQIHNQTIEEYLVPADVRLQIASLTINS